MCAPGEKASLVPSRDAAPEPGIDQQTQDQCRISSRVSHPRIPKVRLTTTEMSPHLVGAGRLGHEPSSVKVDEKAGRRRQPLGLEPQRQRHGPPLGTAERQQSLAVLGGQRGVKANKQQQSLRCSASRQVAGAEGRGRTGNERRTLDSEGGGEAAPPSTQPIHPGSEYLSFTQVV